MNEITLSHVWAAYAIQTIDMSHPNSATLLLQVARILRPDLDEQTIWDGMPFRELMHLLHAESGAILATLRQVALLQPRPTLRQTPGEAA